MAWHAGICRNDGLLPGYARQIQNVPDYQCVETLALLENLVTGTVKHVQAFQIGQHHQCQRLQFAAVGVGLDRRQQLYRLPGEVAVRYRQINF